MSRQTAGRGGDPKKISGELFTLTYGALVSQLVKDYEDEEEVNRQLDKMGYNIGIRLIEDFLARTNTPRCNDLRETADIIAKTGFKLFLGVTPTVSNFQMDEFSLVFESNPLSEFVELPEHLRSLSYSQILCGVIRGALHMVQLEVRAWFVQDQLRGDPVTELRVKFVRRLEDAVPAGDD